MTGAPMIIGMDVWTPRPAPGWYNDPSHPHVLRWWTGSEWHVETRSLADVLPPDLPSRASRFTTGFTVMALCYSLCNIPVVMLTMFLMAWSHRWRLNGLSSLAHVATYAWVPAALAVYGGRKGMPNWALIPMAALSALVTVIGWTLLVTSPGWNG